ncbi:50S ribosomal protein L11 methyltransferase [Millionella massiliensis]|uniref:50S ribosomal protein L11 methyltransferase n=1 Tax=Millionella massiliensis TaxID=1871023 RepID=UPI0008DB16C5|nr:50S ribosomal protein L11 methyltransferase [Millionella massiliensis]
MNYIEYNIHVTGPEEGEIVIAELSDMGFESFSDYLPDGFMPGAGSIKCYIPANVEADSSNHTRIQNYLYNEGYPYEREEIQQQNWNAEWESQFEPISIQGGTCYIRAPFHPAHSAPYEIVIMPKMSFGTGHHATTYLMAEQMLALDFNGASVLDMGSGTGILSILAAMRGAVVVDAVDIDEWAYENCLENIQTNNVQTVVCPILGDVSAIHGKVYDIILANINRNILLNDMAQYTESLRKGGLLLVSGILDLDVDTLVGHARKLGLTPTATNTRDGWAQITFQKA